MVIDTHRFLIQNKTEIKETKKPNPDLNMLNYKLANKLNLPLIHLFQGSLNLHLLVQVPHKFLKEKKKGHRVRSMRQNTKTYLNVQILSQFLHYVMYFQNDLTT